MLSYGAWSASHEGGIAIEFLVDRLSLAFAALSAAIAGIVSAFSNRYLHRESGYNRYFVLLAMFVTGMLLVALAGNVAVLFIGWEFVGLSSALLVAFFHERPAAVSNALARVLGLPHQRRRHAVGGGSAAPRCRHRQPLAPVWRRRRGVDDRTDRNRRDDHCRPPHRRRRGQECAAALLELAAARDGGTHAVERRLLWIALDSRRMLSVAARRRRCSNRRRRRASSPESLGAATAVFAGITTRVQSDVKSSLAYASLTQVGIIVVEIAIGWYTIAFVHLAGHACFRLLQFLSAPNVLHDLHGIEDAIGDRPSPGGGHFELVTPDRLRQRLFLVALERGFLDSLLDRAVVEPFTRFARQLTRMDGWLCDAVLPTGWAEAVDGGEDQDE